MREPEPTHMPTEQDLTPGIFSEMILTPFVNVWSRISPFCAMMMIRPLL